MQRRRFLALVRRALQELPPRFQDALVNVAVVVERRPRRQHLRSARLRPGQTLFGLYEGIPLTERGGDYSLVPPDKVTIFQEPLERACTDERALVAEIRRTVLHELAHYFGLSDEELRRLGLE